MMIAETVQSPGLPSGQAGSTITTPHGGGIDSLQGRWWVLHTKARNEKATAADLDKMHINYFLPLVECRRTSGGRTRSVRIPLFPGYVFLCGGLEDRLAVLRTNRVANVLEVTDQERLKVDLRQIYRVIESEVPVDLHPQLRRGRRCRVTGGTLVGLEGVVLRRRGLWRVYVGVEFLGQSAELEIDPMLLEVID
ncbi:MAG: transcription termination/antitermination NusG family protein [Phycisphaerae bacterium]